MKSLNNVSTNKTLNLYIYFSFFFFLLWQIDNTFKPSLVTVYVGLSALIYYLFMIYKNDAKIFLLNILIITAYTQTIFSNTINESNNIYLSELNQTTFLNGSTVTNIFYFSLLFLGIKFGTTIVAKRIKITKTIYPFALLNKIKSIFIFLIIVLIASLIIYDSPLLMGMNRLTYRQDISEFPIQLIFNLTNSLLYFIVIIHLFDLKNKRKINYFLFIYCCIQILHGDRFSGLFFGLSIVIISFSIFRSQFPEFRVILKSVLALFIIGVLIMFVNVSKASDVDPITTMLMRISLQSEVWWSTQNYISNHPADYSLFFGNVMGIGTDNSSSGINYMMKILAHKNVYDLYIELGSKLTMGAPSLLLVCFGYGFGGLAVLFSGFLLGKALNFLLLASNSGAFISGFFYLKIFMIMNYAIIMGDYPKLISPHIFFYLFLAIATSGWKFLPNRN